MSPILNFILGLAGLVFGAELLVKGAARLGLLVGISPLVIGLTIVAFGTSSPELAVSINAALSNHQDVVLGTCIGSTIFNILFILGVSSIISPLVVVQQLIWYEVPIMIGAHILLWLLALDGVIDKIDALILFVGIVVYTIFAIQKGRKESSKAVSKEYKQSMPKTTKSKDLLTVLHQIGLVIGGLLFCVKGAEWLLEGALTIARNMGISELVIGATIIAASTSLPEVATSIMATIRGQRDIAIGNVVGSNIFNILAIIGLAGLVSPNPINVSKPILTFDLPAAIMACFACLPIFFTGHKISRWEGILFLFYYIIYVSYVIFLSIDDQHLPIFEDVMIWFIIPMSVVTFSIFAYRSKGK